MALATKFYWLKRPLAERYNTTIRSIDRWVQSGRFPPADIVLPNGRKAWSDVLVEAHERTLVKRVASSVTEEIAAI
jgi:hypothetical protein